MINLNATYSLEDNKIRIYPLTEERLNPEDYAKVKAAGFIWAPRQKLFVAPMWTPEREAVALYFAEQIENEDITLEQRAIERSERFENYSTKRAADAERTADLADELSEPFKDGQPILIGHHSQRKAEKLRDRIQSTMKKAVNFYECSTYWATRSAGVLSHAASKSNVSTRINRIKGLESDKRKQEKYIKEVNQSFEFLDLAAKMKTQDKKNYILGAIHNLSLKLSVDEAVSLGLSATCYQLTNKNGYFSPYDLRETSMTMEEMKTRMAPSRDRALARINKWLEHFEMRISYEREMRKASGHEMPDFKAIGKARAKATTSAPIVNTPDLKGLTRQCGSGVETVEVFTLTKEQFKEMRSGHINRAAGFRYRAAMGCFLKEYGLKYKKDSDHWKSFAIYIEGQKRVEVPTNEAVKNG